MAAPTPSSEQQSPLQQITQPFIDLAHAPRALWGINLAYFLEGWVYFGMLGYLAMHFSDFIFAGNANPDVDSHHMVMVLTAGITISMFFLGSVADKKGVRTTLLTAFGFLLVGRLIWSAAPIFFPDGGMWSGTHIMTMCGILFVVIGYGMYQPAAYAGVRQFTSPKTAAMGYAMLYALMNLGGWLPSFFSPIRNAIGISGAFWVYTSITVVAVVVSFLILTPTVERIAIARAKKERDEEKTAEDAGKTVEEKAAAEKVATKAAELAAAGSDRVPPHLYLVLLGVAAACWFLLPSWMMLDKILAGAFVLMSVILVASPSLLGPVARWLADHPLSNTKFFFFIFALIPVQTLFTYNWLILPQYLERAFEGGFVGENFEFFANMNPILIFIAVPMITAMTMKKKVYSMMIIGTFVMAAPAFLLAFDTSIYTLMGYLLIMTVGEAMWQPRFLQYAAEIAPAGRTGAYMGVAQFPWFLTKMLVPLYSGHMLQKYVPSEGAKDPETMWLYFAIVAMCSTVLLIVAKGWVGKDFKTTSA